MAWTVVRSAGNHVAGSSTLTVTLGATPATGNKIVFCMSLTATPIPSISTVRDGAANNLTQAALASNATGKDLTAVYFYDVPATPSTTFTVTSSSSTTDISGVVQEVSGLLAGNTTACLDGTWGTLTGSASPTGSATYTSTAANEFLFTSFGDFGNSATATQPTGYTLDANSVNTSSTADSCAAYKNSTNGSEASAWSYTTTGNQWGTVTGAFKLAGGTPALITYPRRVLQAVRRGSVWLV